MLEGRLYRETLSVAADSHDRHDAPCAPIDRRGIALRETARDLDDVFGVCMAHVRERHVVMLTPEKGHITKRCPEAQHVARDRLAVSLSDHPVFDAHGRSQT